MYAIPAETASQNMPFKKEDLPGPGESIPLIQIIYLGCWVLNGAILLQTFRTLADLETLQRRYRQRLVSEMANNCSFVKMTTV